MRKTNAELLRSHLENNRNRIGGINAITAGEQIILQGKYGVLAEHRQFALEAASKLALRRNCTLIEQNHKDGTYSITFVKTKGGRA